jgi:hypothetical protein
MSAKPIGIDSQERAALREREVDIACAAAPNPVEATLIWAQARVSDPRLMRHTISKLRQTNKEWLESEDEDERRLAIWWCSEQHIRDQADRASAFDADYLESFGGGPVIFHPDYGPREALAHVRNMVSAFRIAALKVFPDRLSLEEVYLDSVCGTFLHLPEERWGEGWDERSWAAFLYKTGMRSLWNIADSIGLGNWPHVLDILLSAKDILHTFAVVENRPMMMLAERERQRVEQVTAFQREGAKARVIYGDAQREHWRALYASDFSAHSARRGAELIAARLHVPPSAVETIRKVISRKTGKPL